MPATDPLAVDQDDLRGRLERAQRLARELRDPLTPLLLKGPAVELTLPEPTRADFRLLLRSLQRCDALLEQLEETATLQAVGAEP